MLEICRQVDNPSVFYCWRAHLFAVMMPVMSNTHRPGNVIMMVVNGLAPKRHQYISKHNGESSAIPVYSSSLKQSYTVHIVLHPLNKRGR